MRDPQKISSAALLSLRTATPVQSGGLTVALILPVRPASLEAAEAALAVIAEDREARSLEEQAKLDEEFG
jgi:hypothetical protein